VKAEWIGVICGRLLDRRHLRILRLGIGTRQVSGFGFPEFPVSLILTYVLRRLGFLLRGERQVYEDFSSPVKWTVIIDLLYRSMTVPQVMLVVVVLDH
jgi:hypothetical protein